MVMVMMMKKKRGTSKKTRTRLMTRQVRRTLAKKWMPGQRTSSAKLSPSIRRSKSSRC